MKLIIILSVCVIACLAEFYTLPKDNYTPETLKNDDEEIKRRVDCYLDKGTCSEVSQAYKDIVNDALTSNCEKCSPELKQALKGFVELVNAKMPEKFTELRAKYDPDGSKYQPFMDALKA